MALQMDLLGVLALSVGVSCFIEFMQWVLIYRCGTPLLLCDAVCDALWPAVAPLTLLAMISVLLSTRTQTEVTCDHAAVTCCRRPHFRQVKQWLAVQNKKLADLTKDSGPGTGALKGKAKKQARVLAAFQHTCCAAVF